MYRFSSECAAVVASHILSAEAPSFATIAELDRKVQEYSLITTGPLASAATAALDVSLTMRRMAMLQSKEAREIISLLRKSYRGSSHLTRSTLICAPKFLRPSYYRPPCKPPQEPLFAVVSGHVPCFVDYSAKSPRSIHPLAQVLLPLLGDVDIRV